LQFPGRINHACTTVAEAPMTRHSQLLTKLRLSLFTMPKQEISSAMVTAPIC